MELLHRKVPGEFLDALPEGMKFIHRRGKEFLVVEELFCPRGHSLMSGSVRTHGEASIRVRLRPDDDAGRIFLDAFWGSHAKPYSFIPGPGDHVEYIDAYCPQCSANLSVPELCPLDDCGARKSLLFHLPGTRNGIYVCSRLGCPAHFLSVTSLPLGIVEQVSGINYFGHGNVHKLIAEAIDHFGIQDRVIFCSPVGCSVFGYYYFDTGNVQCAHGRAPAVATGLRRSLKDAIIISYQGDGDLAGIGIAEIIHAANRGENITVYFVNNAIYGMTGGQMAPTTIVGQKTLTTPNGRTVSGEGNPIGMCELLSSLETPWFIEQVSLANRPRTLRARKAIRQALRNQIDGKGFSMVEILSPCPVNWKMTAGEARSWIISDLEPVFPVRNFRDRDRDRNLDRESDEGDASRGKPAGDSESGPEVDGAPQPRVAIPAGTAVTGTTVARPAVSEPAAAGSAVTRSEDRGSLSDDDLVALLASEHEIVTGPRSDLPNDLMVKVVGFGGQGVLSAGILLANCATIEGFHATWLPSYGPEMRGGIANASVIVSEDAIGSPPVDEPDVSIAMNGPSLDAFEERVCAGGIILMNSSVITRDVRRSDVRSYALPASDIAKRQGLITAAKVVLLTILALIAGAPSVDTIRKVIPESLRRKELIDVNLKLVDEAVNYFRQHPFGPAHETCAG